MMACSYLSAGGLKSEPTSAACWSPPAMTSYLADTRPVLPTTVATLSTSSLPLLAEQNEPTEPSGPIGPRTSIALPRMPMTLPREQLVLSNSLAATAQGLCSMGLPSATIGLPGSQSGLARPSSSGASILPNPQIGLPLPPPFARPILDRHCSLILTGVSTEPALDLSTSAPITPSLKPRSSQPDEETE